MTFSGFWDVWTIWRKSSVNQVGFAKIRVSCLLIEYDFYFRQRYPQNSQRRNSIAQSIDEVQRTPSRHTTFDRYSPSNSTSSAFSSMQIGGDASPSNKSPPSFPSDRRLSMGPPLLPVSGKLEIKYLISNYYTLVSRLIGCTDLLTDIRTKLNQNEPANGETNGQKFDRFSKMNRQTR